MGLFNLFKKKESIDVNKPIVNPHLKKEFKVFDANKSEATLQVLFGEIKKANLLVLITTNQLNSTKAEGVNKTIFEVGSKFNFLKTYDENGNSFLPAFTDWEEIDLWVESRDNIAGWIMTTAEIFEFVLKSKNDKGLVINPCSDMWTMSKEQIATFLKETLN